MIIDKLENYSLYTTLHPRFENAFNFILNNDLASIETGKHLIDGDNLFAIVDEYETRDPSTAKLESHFNYIDIQYVIQGSENMGVGTLKNETPIEVNEDNDIAFYDENCSFVKMEQGMFAIFFPDDLHMPGVTNDSKSKVKKLVIKVLRS